MNRIICRYLFERSFQGYKMREITLNGIWDFFYNPQEFEAEKTALPGIKDYSGKMVIPGYWDDHYELFGA